MMIQYTIRVELLASKEDAGGYIVYAFKDLSNGTYKMCTRCPNWEGPFLRVGDIGYLKCKEVYAGEDTWYNPITDSLPIYISKTLFMRNHQKVRLYCKRLSKLTRLDHYLKLI